MNGAGTDLDELAARLRGAERGRIEIPDFRAAAVLVPILDTPRGPELLFTVRADDLPHHPGQIAFPGGALEPGEGVVEAALRETREEIGLAVEPERVLGLLDDHPSPAGYVATPVVALLPEPAAYTLNRREVAEVFAAPLAELRAITPEAEPRQLREYRRLLHSYPWRQRRIWGFTGNVLKNLLDVLEGTATAFGGRR